MIDYDPGQPLIVIHIPKAAGTSSMQFYKHWFGEGFLSHYRDEKQGQLPQKHDLFALHTEQRPIVLHGHFNMLRRFGIEEYYPNIKQFVTILRDPFELTVSRYFYTRKVANNRKRMVHIDANKTLAEYLATAKPNLLNHFPRQITQANFKDIIEEFFIDIGITEHLESSMKRIAGKLGKPYVESLLGHHNSTERDQEIPSHSREQFIERNPLEFAVYDYALMQFRAADAAPHQLHD